MRTVTISILSSASSSSQLQQTTESVGRSNNTIISLLSCGRTFKMPETLILDGSRSLLASHILSSFVEGRPATTKMKAHITLEHQEVHRAPALGVLAIMGWAQLAKRRTRITATVCRAAAPLEWAAACIGATLTPLIRAQLAAIPSAQQAH